METTVFKNEWTDIIKEYSPLSETLGLLHPKLLNLVYQQKWFNLYVPKIYGGEEKTLPEILRIIEGLAKADGSLAWTVTLCSGAAWFSGFLDKQLATEIFINPQACFAGSGAVGGTATKTSKGYLINGFWEYASGALHATIFTANCILKDNKGNSCLDNNGKEIIKSFILKKEEVTIISGWSYIGLVATGSHAFKVKDLEVSDNRVFEINESIKFKNPIFNYPFLQLAETTLTVNNAGMALHFIDLVELYFYKRSGLKRYNQNQINIFEKELSKCKTEIKQARDLFYSITDESFKQILQFNKIDDDVLQSVSEYSRKLSHVSRQIVDILYPYCGLEAAKKESELNRVWRDIHTASQHSLLTFLK
jgi:alkylation response protein AidB-like acyl-CoA dehydrogenase